MVGCCNPTPDGRLAADQCLQWIEGCPCASNSTIDCRPHKSVGRGSMLRRLLFFGIALLAAPIHAETFALTGATLVDLRDFGRTTRDIPNSIVVVRDGQIIAVGHAGQIQVPKSARRIDARGKWLIPGLIDGFSSQRDQGFANANLAMGVTTISQTADGDPGRGSYVPAAPQPNMRRLDNVTGYDASSLKGDAGPTGLIGWTRIYHEGRRLSDAELRADVDSKAAHGIAGLMLMYPLDDTQVRIATEEAKRRGLFTIGELGHSSYVKASDAGVNTFVHASRVEAELAPPDLRQAVAEQPFGRPTDPVIRRYHNFLTNLDARSAAFKRYASTLAAHHTAIMPTLALWSAYLPQSPNPWTSPVGPLIDAKKVAWPFDRLTGRASVPQGEPAGYASALIQQMRAFHAAGVPMLAGSGAVGYGILPGWGIHREMAMLTQAGLTPREAIASATDNYAQLYGWNDVGRIAPGYRADLVLLTADPTKNITATQNISAIFFGGQQLDRTALLAWRPRGSN